MSETKKDLPNKEKAVFKLLVYFKDGKKRTLYNYHTSWSAEKKQVIECEKTALSKLKKLILFNYKDQYTTAIIIHRPTDRVLEKYVFGRLQFANTYNFIWQNNKVVLVISESNLKIA